MISKKMENMVANSSAIRAMFEEGNRLAQKYGAENVFDFSLGNPNVPAPESVKKAIIELLNDEDPIVLHGYTNSNAGYEDVRSAVAQSLNERFGTSFAARNITMTVGAAGGKTWLEGISFLESGFYGPIVSCPGTGSKATPGVDVPAKICYNTPVHWRVRHSGS